MALAAVLPCVRLRECT